MRGEICDKNTSIIEKKLSISKIEKTHPCAKILFLETFRFNPSKKTRKFYNSSEMFTKINFYCNQNISSV